MKAIDKLFDCTILIADDEITKREMLVNILSDEYKIIMTADGIRSVLEKNGLVTLLDRYVWEETARQIRKWKDDLGVPVVAEGVETEEECKMLKEAGCDIIQGYYFSKPIPPEDIGKFVGADK